MVEHTMNPNMDAIFHSLADPIRRDILSQISGKELSVGDLVDKYTISFAAVSKHLKMLEAAQLIRKRKEGRKHMITLQPETLREAEEYLERYRQTWQSRFEKLDALLNERN